MAVTLSTYNQTTALVAGQRINLANLKIMNLNASATFNAAHTKISQVSNGSTATITAPVASPGVVNWTGHGFSAGQAVTLSTTGALPTGVTPGTVYYVIPAGLTTNAFQVSASPGGSAINFTGSTSGVHSGYSIGAYEISGNAWPKGGVLIPNVAVTSIAINDGTVNDAMIDGDDMSVDAAGGFISAFKQCLYDSVTGNVLIFADLGEEVKAGDTTPFKIRLAALGFLNLQLT